MKHENTSSTDGYKPKDKSSSNSISVKNINPKLSYKDLFVLIMQAVAVTASFIPMLFVGGYSMPMVIGVLAIQFVFWYNINAGAKKILLTKITEKREKDTPYYKDQNRYDRKTHSIARDLAALYKTNTVTKGEVTEAEATACYLNERIDYLKKKQGVNDDKNLDFKQSQQFESAYQHVLKLSANEGDAQALKEIKLKLEKEEAWQKIVAKHALKLHNNATQKGSSHSDTIEKVAYHIGNLAAFFGNALGCTGSGFTMTALLWSMPPFVTLASAYAPFLLTIALPIGLASTLFVCGFFAHYCNTVPAIKQIMKEFLYRAPTAEKTATTEENKGDKDKKLDRMVQLRLAFRAIIEYVAYIAAIVMACAISTINFLTGKFFGWLMLSAYLNPASILSLPMATMATLAAPYTALGIGLGAVSALVTFIGLTCFFVKYVPLGVLGLFDTICDTIGFGIKATENNETKVAENNEPKASPLLIALSYVTIALFVIAITYFATASICFFVANVLGTQFVPITRACGALMYFNQSFDVGKHLFSTEALSSYYEKTSIFTSSAKAQASTQATIEFAFPNIAKIPKPTGG